VAALLYGLLFVIVARGAAVMSRQQRALVAAEKLATAGEMASAVAHGLRNPLASIRSTAELGLETGAKGETGALLAEIVAQADRLEGWIRQFLTSARSGSDAPAAAEVGVAVEECASAFGPSLARRRLELALDVERGLPTVRCHPVILRQVLNSVLANAVEASPPGGRVAVGARRRRWRRGVVVEIRDTGPGMSRAGVAAALSPFATTKPAGLGLGLPLAREALERHGGGLAVESRPGTGTAVRLLLPATARGANGGLRR
jgi:signal transduction histidine kinase